MSVATEVAPEVYIPERARTATRDLRLVPIGADRRAVGFAGAGGEAGTPGRVGTAGIDSAVIDAAVIDAAVIDLAGRRVARSRDGLADGLGSRSLDARDVVQAPLRLTRRGVIALSLLAVSAAVLLLFIAHLSAGAQSGRGTAGFAGATAPGGFASSGVVTVQPGDTLWSIAGRVAPHRDPRPVVDRLQRLNSLHGAALIAGQTLKVS